MILMKFGGSSVADAPRILELGRIVAGRRRESPVVVVSALGGVTDRLLDAANAAGAGKESESRKLLAELEQRHAQVVAECGLAAADRDLLQGVITGDFNRLREILHGVALLR